jgi:hypothetical protein
MEWVVNKTPSDEGTDWVGDFNLDVKYTSPRVDRLEALGGKVFPTTRREAVGMHDCMHLKVSTPSPLMGPGRWYYLDADDGSPVAVYPYIDERGRSHHVVPPDERWIGARNYTASFMKTAQALRSFVVLKDRLWLVDLITMVYISGSPAMATATWNRRLVYWAKTPDGVQMDTETVATRTRQYRGLPAQAALSVSFTRWAQLLGVPENSPSERRLLAVDVLSSVIAKDEVVPYSEDDPVTVCDPASDEVVETFKRTASGLVKAYRTFYSKEPDARRDYGDAVKKALADLKYVDINTFAYLKEAAEMVQSGSYIAEAGPIRAFAAAPSLVGLANCVLSASYGTRLTVSDTEELCDGIRRLRDDFCYRPLDIATIRGWSSPGFEVNPLHVERLCTAAISYHQQNDSIRDLWSLLNQWDLEPSLSNLWDLVPYSFVVDWFSNVGECLEAVDVRSGIDRLSVAYYVRSYQDTLSYTDVALATHGTTRIDLKYYKREIKPPTLVDSPLPDMELHTPPVSVLPQLGALIVQALL